jgi:integrase
VSLTLGNDGRAESPSADTSLLEPSLVESLAPTRAVCLILEELRRSGLLAEQSTDRLGRTIVRFGRYLEMGIGLADLGQVRPEHADGFIHVSASPGAGSRPRVSTQHFRRSVIRLLFRVARQLNLADTDPTLDIALPPRSALRRRPLTDDESALCRSAALRTLTETRQPAAWALGEATARTSELPHIRCSDLDLHGGRVWIHGGARTLPRWGTLTTWGRTQIARRVQAIKGASDPDPLLVYAGRGSPESRQASSCIAVSETLRRAGLSREPDLSPVSVAAWAGARDFAEGAPIDEVARRLGVRSLDRAASLICWDWLKET